MVAADLRRVHLAGGAHTPGRRRARQERKDGAGGTLVLRAGPGQGERAAVGGDRELAKGDRTDREGEGGAAEKAGGVGAGRAGAAGTGEDQAKRGRGAAEAADRQGETAGGGGEEVEGA